MELEKESCFEILPKRHQILYVLTDINDVVIQKIIDVAIPSISVSVRSYSYSFDHIVIDFFTQHEDNIGENRLVFELCDTSTSKKNSRKTEATQIVSRTAAAAARRDCAFTQSCKNRSFLFI